MTLEERPVYKLSKLETRWVNPENYDGAKGASGKANFGRKGSPCRGAMKSGEAWTLLDAKGSGTVRRIWITLGNWTPELIRGMVIRMYWDGDDKPAVEAPLGDFFCNALGRRFVFSNAWFNNPEGRNWNCCLPMPFRQAAKVTIANESPQVQGCLWYHIDYTLGDIHDDDTGYFHAYYNRENPCVPRRDFNILPRVEGRGRYLGCNLGLITAPYYNTWWGEGEVKIFLDGDREYPTLCGTGTEDYICTAWGTGSFSLPWYGNKFLPVPDPDFTQASMYRLHGPDPVHFQKEVRVTLQAMGYFAGQPSVDQMALTGKQDVLPAGEGKKRVTLAELKANPANWPNLFEREDDWSAVAYFYLDRTSTALPAIAPYKDRVAGLTGDEWPRALTVKTALAKAVIKLPALKDLQYTADREATPDAAMAIMDNLVKEQETVIGFVAEARKILVNNESPALAGELEAAIDKVERAGLADKRYPARAAAIRKRLAADSAQQLIVTNFKAGTLRPPVGDIAAVKIPAGLVYDQDVPFVPQTELADIRLVHDGAHGLVFIEGTVSLAAGCSGRLLYGADGPVKAWVNGKAVDCRPDATNPARIAQYAVPAKWKKGKNKVVFALSTNHGKAWGVVVRVSRI